MTVKVGRVRKVDKRLLDGLQNEVVPLVSIIQLHKINIVGEAPINAHGGAVNVPVDQRIVLLSRRTRSFPELVTLP